MPTIKNMSYGPLSVSLKSGETLTLAPQQTAEVSEHVFKSEAVQKQIKQGALSAVKESPDINIPKKK